MVKLAFWLYGIILITMAENRDSGLSTSNLQADCRILLASVASCIFLRFRGPLAMVVIQ